MLSKIKEVAETVTKTLSGGKISNPLGVILRAHFGKIGYIATQT